VNGSEITGLLFGDFSWPKLRCMVRKDGATFQPKNVATDIVSDSIKGMLG
jgi:hypothetical protein